MADPILPPRRHLPHEVAPWVERGGIYLVTNCGQPRGSNQLCQPAARKIVAESIAFRQQRGDWHTRLILAMPDHLHALVSVPDETALRKTIRKRKSFLARNAGIRWQRDCFEHRLRNEESLDPKSRDIRENPIRAGLVAKCEDWPYEWEPQNGGPGRSALSLTADS